MPVKYQDPGDVAVGPGQRASAGVSPQTAGVANLNDAFGGDAAAAQQSLNVQQYYRDHPELTPQQVQSVQNASIQQANAYYNPDTLADKIFGGLALAGSVAGVGLLSGGVLAPALAAAAGGGVAGGIAGGAGAGLASGAFDSALTGQNIGKGALIGGLTGGIGGGASASMTQLGLDPTLAKGLSGAATGAVRGGLSGSGAGLGALSGGLSGAASGANTDLGGNAFTGALAGLGASQLSNAIGGSNNVSTPNPIQAGAQPAMSGIPSSNGGMDINSLLQMFGGAAGTGLGIAANNNQSSMQQNAYTTAGNAANYQPWSVGGVAGGAQFNNGQINLGTGGFNPSSFSGLTNGAMGQASQYANGGLPPGVTSAGNNAMAQYGTGQNTANAGVGQANSMFNQGNNLVNGANGTYDSAYNTSLNAATQALQPAFQQQSNALRNQQFSTGMSGTSGGALQSQAMYNAQNQATLQAQQNAVGQANTAFGTALNGGTSLMNSGLTNLGNFNTQGANMASNGLNAQQGLAAFSPQLAGMYGNVGQQGITAASGLNTIGTSDATLGLNAMQVGGNNMNNAARTQGAISQSSNYTNPMAGYSTALNSLFGNTMGSGASGLGGLGSLFSSLFGGSGGGNFDSSGMSNTGSLIGGQTQVGGDLPSFDFSNIGNQAYDPSAFDNIWGSTT